MAPESSLERSTPPSGDNDGLQITAEWERDYSMDPNQMPRPILTLTWQCDELTDQSLAIARDSVQAIVPRLEDHKRRYVAWWEVSRVFAASNTNMDRLLQHKVIIRDIVIRLLVILRKNLLDCKSAQMLKLDPCSTGHHGWIIVTLTNPVRDELNREKPTIALGQFRRLSEDSMLSNNPPNEQDQHETSSKSQISQHEVALEAVEYSVAELNRVTSAIRASGKTSETLRARQFTQKKYSHLLADYDILATIAVETLHPNAPQDLQTQLARSMTDRYARILYRQDRDGRAISQSGIYYRGVSTIPAKSKVSDHKAKHHIGSGSVPIEHKGDLQKIGLYSEDARTSIDSSKFHRNMDRKTRSRHGGATTVALMTGTYEPPPLEFDGKEEIQCPWCFTYVTKEVLESKGIWSKAGR